MCKITSKIFLICTVLLFWVCKKFIDLFFELLKQIVHENFSTIMYKCNLVLVFFQTFSLLNEATVSNMYFQCTLYMWQVSWLFQTIALLLLLVGGHMFLRLHGVEKLTDAKQILIPASIFIAAGIALFLLGVVGCAGALKEQKCLLGFVCVLILCWNSSPVIFFYFSVLCCPDNNLLWSRGERGGDVPVQEQAEIESGEEHGQSTRWVRLRWSCDQKCRRLSKNGKLQAFGYFNTVFSSRSYCLIGSI